MTLAQFVVGWALLALWVGAPALAAVLIRRRLLPGWTGARALLVDVLATLALLLTVAQLLGTHGGLTRPGLTAGALLVGSGGALFAARLPVNPVATPARPPEPLWSRALGLGGVASVLGVWLSSTQEVLSAGNYDSDSLSYHWPYAAFFAETGWTTRIHLGPAGGGSSWHAANGELLGGISIVAFHRDWMLPLLNLGWLALALLAARCVGRRYAASGLAVAVACLLFALPILSRSQGGSGFTDTASLALVLAGVALFLEAFDAGLSAPVLLLCGLAFGLAASTKETTLAVGAGFAGAVLVLCVRAGRARAFGWWATPAVLLGSFWYVRNLVREGNPIPTSHLGPFPSIAGSFIEDYGYSVGHFIGDPHVIRHIFIPGLVLAWGQLWPALLLGASAAAVLTVRRSEPSHLRALAAIGALGLVAYVFTPTTALGFKDRPLLFPENTRYALPAMAVLLMLLVRVMRGHRARFTLGAGTLVTLVATLVPSGSFPPMLPGHEGSALVIGATAVVALSFCAWLPRWRRGVGALALVLAMPWLFVMGNDYERDRYRPTYSPESRVFAWANQVHGVRIGLAGIAQEYPFVGNDVSNRVNYIGLRDAHRVFIAAPSCASWRRAVNVGHFDYVVVGPVRVSETLAPGPHWPDPAALRVVLAYAGFHVFRVAGELDPSTCA